MIDYRASWQSTDDGDIYLSTSRDGVSRKEIKFGEKMETIINL